MAHRSVLEWQRDRLFTTARNGQLRLVYGGRLEPDARDARDARGAVLLLLLLLLLAADAIAAAIAATAAGRGGRGGRSLAQHGLRLAAQRGRVDEPPLA